MSKLQKKQLKGKTLTEKEKEKVKVFNDKYSDETKDEWLGKLNTINKLTKQQEDRELARNQLGIPNPYQEEQSYDIYGMHICCFTK